MAKVQAVAGRTGVLLVNTGTPDEPTPRAVKRYLRRFLTDKRIVPMNRLVWGCILNLFILPKRSKASAAKYREIWTPQGSPFQIAHEKLAAGLQDHYREKGCDTRVALAMSYGEPGVLRALRSLKEEGCERLVVLPLYPQSAYSTTGAVRDGVARAVRKARWQGSVEIIDNYHDNSVYIRAMAASIKNAGFDPQGTDRVLFSYHSIPLKDIDDGDTYELQTGATSLYVAGELGLDRKRWTVSYQSRFDKGRDWLRPFTKDTLRLWATAGEGRVFFVCPNFAVDCLETLYDVKHDLAPFFHEAAREAGEPKRAEDFEYVPCLNASKAHLSVLVDVLKPYVDADETALE